MSLSDAVIYSTVPKSFTRVQTLASDKIHYSINGRRARRRTDDKESVHLPLDSHDWKFCVQRHQKVSKFVTANLLLSTDNELRRLSTSRRPTEKIISVAGHQI